MVNTGGGNDLPRVAFFGAGEVGHAFLSHLLDLFARGRCTLVGIHASHPDAAAVALVRDLARDAGVVAQGPPEALFAAGEVDIVFSAGNHHLFSQVELAASRRGIINFHAAPLPAYRGSACPAFAILNGETRFGVTFHLVVAQLDAGPIVHSESFAIDSDDTSGNVDRRCIEVGAAAFRANAENWMAGVFGTRRNRPERPPYRRADIEAFREVDLTWPEQRIWDHVRACDWPGVIEPAYVRIAERRIYLTTSARGGWLASAGRATAP